MNFTKFLRTPPVAASVKSTYFENIIGNHLTQLSPLPRFKQTLSRLHVISIFVSPLKQGT